MNLYILSMVLTVASNIGYHLCQKNISAQINPFFSILVTYFVGIVVTLIALPVFQFPGGFSWSEQLKAVNWATVSLGLAAVGLELGFLLVYRSGWQISIAALFSNATVAVLMCPVGLIFFSEEITLKRSVGLVVTLLGIALLRK